METLLLKCQYMYFCTVRMAKRICEHLNICNMHTALVSQYCHGAVWWMGLVVLYIALPSHYSFECYFCYPM